MVAHYFCNTQICFLFESDYLIVYKVCIGKNKSLTIES